ncbi:MAG: glutamate racemase [Bacteroidota bacterium]
MKVATPDPNLPIGVFDSGLGGLTIVKAIQALLPQEEICYYGDTAHLPYGDKSAVLVQEFSRNIARFLVKHPVKAVVIACNTASATALEEVQKVAGTLPVFDVINPAVKVAIESSRTDQIGVIGTRTTIRSGVYTKKLLSHSPTARIIEKATPLLVPMIEEGWLQNAVSQDVIDAYLSDTGFQQIDCLILGCTHYPLIKPQVQRYFEENYDHQVEVVDSSLAVARSLSSGLLQRKIIRQDPKKTPHHIYFLSDYNVHFEETARVFLGKSLHFEVSPL